MKASLLTIACVVFAALLISTPQAAWSKNTNNAQKEKGRTEKGRTVIELKGTKGAATRGSEADPNIKSDKQINDLNDQAEAPAQKGGVATRGGGGCEVRLDNRTSLFIKIYVDGAYRGTLSPYGDSVVFVLPGETHVYARADFDDGTFYYWGPSAYACGAGQYIYFKMVK